MLKSSATNSYLYNDKELFEEGDLGWYDYGFREYDAQIGRFIEIYPLTDDYTLLSGYHYALNDPVNNIDVDGLGSVDPLLQMVQCQGVVLHESIKIGLTQAIAGIANVVVNRVQQKNGAKQAGNQSENVNRKSLDGIKGPTAPQQFKKIDRGFPVYVSEPVSISYIRDPTKTRSHTSLSFDAYNTKVKERQIQAQIERENRQQAEVVVGMLTFAFPELLAFEIEYLFAEQVAVRSIAAKRGYSTVYRAVSKAELADIAKLDLEIKQELTKQESYLRLHLKKLRSLVKTTSCLTVFPIP